MNTWSRPRGKSLGTPKSIGQANNSVVRYTSEQLPISHFSSQCCCCCWLDFAVLMIYLANKVEDTHGDRQTDGDGRIKGRQKRKRTGNVAKERAVIMPAWTQKIAGRLTGRGGRRLTKKGEEGRQTKPKVPREKAWWGVAEFVGGWFRLDLYFINYS